MAQPERVAECFKAMQEVVNIPVTIKHRIGIDGRDSYDELIDFVGQSVEAGCERFIVHARIAILKGLSPKQNREVPPLRYDVAAQLKQAFPTISFILNGGINSMVEASNHLQIFDGVMVGRAAYHNVFEWSEVDQQLFGSHTPSLTRGQLLERMRPYLVEHLTQGGLFQHIARHLLGLGQGVKGARRFRQLLSADIYKNEQPPLQLFDQALAILEQSS